MAGRYILMLIGWWMVISPSIAQLQLPNRFEELIQRDEDIFEPVSVEEYGIILYREVKNTETRIERKYQVILVDTTLNKVWEENYYVHLRYIQIGFEYYGKYFYMLFQRNIESLKADLFVVRINLETREKDEFLIERDYELELSEFEVLGNTLIFGGYTKNLPAVIIYKFGEKPPKALPGFYIEKSRILHLETEDDKQIFNVLIQYRTKKGNQSISFKTFDENGEILKNVNLMPSEEKSLLFGRIITLEGNINLVVGTYTRGRSDMSRGIFIARISPEGDQIINYYNYADLKNFFNYMKARRRKRVTERIERRKIKGKKNRFNYRLLVHEVVPWKGRFIMVGEAFYPKYDHSLYYGYGTPYYGTSSMAFEGYKYTHAVVLGFDRRGRLIWDNSFEINDVLSDRLDQYVHLSISNEEIALLYLYDNELRSKIIKGNEVVEGKTYNELNLSFEYEIIGDNNSKLSGLEKWYKGSLFAYGVYRVRNPERVKISPSQEIFFINKIVYK